MLKRTLRLNFTPSEQDYSARHEDVNSTAKK